MSVFVGIFIGILAVGGGLTALVAGLIWAENRIRENQGDE